MTLGLHCMDTNVCNRSAHLLCYLERMFMANRGKTISPKNSLFSIYLAIRQSTMYFIIAPPAGSASFLHISDPLGLARCYRCYQNYSLPCGTNKLISASAYSAGYYNKTKKLLNLSSPLFLHYSCLSLQVVSHRVWTPRRTSGSRQSTQTAVASLTWRNSSRHWSIPTGPLSMTRPASWWSVSPVQCLSQSFRSQQL